MEDSAVLFYLGKENREILVLTAYNVPAETPAGDNTLHTQQTSLYLLDGEVDPKPKKIFIRDLLTIITTARKEDEDIILAGRLTDVHAHKHDNHANIATYIRGRRRVDYCFASPRILDHVFRCVFEAFHARKVCDHREYFVDLSIVGLFDQRLPAIVNLAERCIRSSHPRLVQKYILKLAEYFEDHNIIRKVTKNQHAYDYEEVEKLDELITAKILLAEREYRHDI